MKKLAKQLAAVSALALLGTSAQAAIVSPGVGSELIVTFANVAGDTISFDTGDTSPVAGDFYFLPSSVLTFINNAGGVNNVNVSLIRGNSATRQYQTSGSADFLDNFIGNGARTTWSNSLNTLVTDLNSSAPASPTSQNDTYGPFVAGSGTPNLIDGFYDTWGSLDPALSNLQSAAGPVFLYNVAFSTANSGPASLSRTGGGIWATVNLDVTNAAGSRINIVPVPAAVWLFASGLGLLGVARRRAR